MPHLQAAQGHALGHHRRHRLHHLATHGAAGADAAATAQPGDAFIATSLALQLAVVILYVATVALRPHIIPGGAPEHAAMYWSALEAVRPGEGYPSRFCDRSELRRPPRSRYSPFAGGIVRVMDHDCIWLGVCIAESNHLCFALFLLCSIGAIAMWLNIFLAVHPSLSALVAAALHLSENGGAAAEARLLICALVIALLLLALLVCLRCS